jgi:predicted dehydrogenase
MASSRVGVGIIGANADVGWAARTHLPVIDALDGFELVAVATTRTESAEAAAQRYGARHAYTDPRALVDDPGVEVVTVSVKVPGRTRSVVRRWPEGR